MRLRFRWILVAAVLLVGPRPAGLAAQAAVPIISVQSSRVTFPGFEPAQPSTKDSSTLAALNAELRRATRPTHWLTGGIIGGAALGVLGAVVGAGMCSDNDTDYSTGTCILAGVGGAAVLGAVGFTVGALIGGLFPKHEAATTSP